MCPATTTSRKRGIMSDEVFERIVSQLPAFPAPPEVSLHGTGEPLLFKRLVQRVNAVVENGGRLILTTNGALMTQEKATELLNSKLGTIQFSVDSMDKDVYEKTRIGLKFDAVIENIKNFVFLRDKINKNLSVEMVFIAYENDDEDVKKYFNFCSEFLMPGDKLRIAARHNFGQEYSTLLLPTNSPCSLTGYVISILYDGSVNLCCVDSEATHRLGHVMENSLVNIFNSPETLRIRELHYTGRRHEIEMCANCTVPECHAALKTIPIT